MRRLVKAIAIAVACLGASHLMEPLFPLGDWRWALVIVASLLVIAFTERHAIRDRFSNNRRLRDRTKDAGKITGSRTVKFKLHEAACLLVDEEPQWPLPSMRSREEYDGLIKAVESDNLMYLTNDNEGNQKPINELHDDSETRLILLGLLILQYEKDGEDFFQTIEVDRKSLREYIQSQSSTIPGFLNEDPDDS